MTVIDSQSFLDVFIYLIYSCLHSVFFDVIIMLLAATLSQPFAIDLKVQRRNEEYSFSLWP